MGLFNIIPDINKEIEVYKSTPGAILLDVRSKEEYAEGHIPSSINIPVEDIVEITDKIKDLQVPIFVYCLRGTRSAKAVKKMHMLGYKNAKSIGGIATYKGLTAI